MRYSIERSSAQIREGTLAVDEIDSDEERQSRLGRKKETLEMDDNLEIQGTRGTEGSDARRSRDPVPPPLETSIPQRSAPDLVLWSDEPGGLLEPAQEERKARGKSVPIGPIIECRKRCSSPSMGPVENMKRELCGLVRCFRIYLREKAKLEITTESPLLPWLVRHCGWILRRYAVRADGRTGYSRLKGREYTAGIAIFGEAIWYKLPKVADLAKLDDRWRTCNLAGKVRQKR